MIGLRVTITGKDEILAGKDDLCVLNGILNVVGKIGAQTKPQGVNGDAVNVDLSIGGLTDNYDGTRNYVRWGFMKNLNIGDKVECEVVDLDAEQFDPIKEGESIS